MIALDTVSIENRSMQQFFIKASSCVQYARAPNESMARHFTPSRQDYHAQVLSATSTAVMTDHHDV